VPTPAVNSASAASASAINAVRAATSSNKKIPIIAGVVGPIALIILGTIGVVLYKRHKRAHDRREWERTHEAIADAVRQVGSPGPIRSPYTSGAWSHLDLSAKGSGDTVTNPYIDKPVAHQSAEYSERPFGVAYSPTSMAAYSPPLSQGYSPFHAQDEAFPVQEQDEAESRPASLMDSSIQVDTSSGSHSYAI